MLASKISRFWPVPLSLFALNLAAGCGSDSGAPAPAVTGGTGNTSGAGGGSSTAGSAGTPAGGGSSGSAPTAGTGGSSGAATAGTGGTDTAGTGGTGGTGGSGGGVVGPGACNTPPAGTVPDLERGPAITGFDGMMTAGQIIGAPGETDIFYVIGHRDGNVFIVQNGAPAGTLITVDVSDGGNNEQGLLSMAFHPDFAANQLFYLYYTAPDGDLTIDEFMRTTPTTASFVQNIFSTPRDGGGEFHNGGSISFDPTDATKSLFLSTGNTSGDSAGDPEGTLGRILQIDVVGKTYATFAYGFRNPYRMSIDRLTGDMYIGDAANGAGGTIILNQKGEMGVDYGYRNNNGSPDVNDGIHRETGGAAIIGGIMYRGSAIPGACGRFFFGVHSGGTIKSAVVEDGAIVGEPFTHDNLTFPGDLTSFGEDGAGELYMAGMNNTIYKIQLAQ